MKKRSARPWLRYSTKDGSVIEVSMQSSPEVYSGEDILYIDLDLAVRFISGEISIYDYLVSSEEQVLLERQHARYIRTHWLLTDITFGSDTVEILERNSNGIVMRRKDKNRSSIVLYVTLANDPNILLSRHLLLSGKSKQRIIFDTNTPHSIYARQHVT